MGVEGRWLEAVTNAGLAGKSTAEAPASSRSAPQHGQGLIPLRARDFLEPLNKGTNAIRDDSSLVT